MTDIDGLNVTEAATFLGVSRTTVYGLLKAGTIPHYRIGTQPRFSRTVLTIWQGGAQMPALMAAVARLAGAVGPTPTAAPTVAPTRLTPKHIGGRRRQPTARFPADTRAGATTDARP